MNRLKWVHKNWLDLCLFISFFALYAATATSYYTYDAVSYALSIRYAEISGSATPLFHPHHLLINVIGMAILKALRIAYPTLQPMHALQLMNAFLGAVGVVVIYKIVRRISIDVSDIPDFKGVSVAAAFSAAACGLSFGFWIASTDGRANIPGVTFALIAAYMAYDITLHPEASKASVTGIVTAIAVLLHQSHFLMIPAVVAAIAIGQSRPKRKLRHAIWFLGTFATVVMVPYILAAQIRGITSFVGLFKWMTTYGRNTQWWDFRILKNLTTDLYALTHAYVASMKISPAHQMFAWGFVTAPLALLAAVVAHIASAFNKRSTELALQGCKHGSFTSTPLAYDPGSALVAANTVWLTIAVSYAVFFTVWCPGYFVFWIPVAVAGVVIVAVNGQAFTRKSLVIAGFFAIWSAALLIVNFTGYISPRSKPSSNGYLMLAKTIKDHTRPGDTIIMTGVGYLAYSDVYVPYFAERNAISLHQVMSQHHGYKIGGMNWLSKNVEQKISEGKGVYILSEVYDSKQAWKLLAARYGLDREDVKNVLSKYTLAPKFKWKDQTVYLLKR